MPTPDRADLIAIPHRDVLKESLQRRVAAKIVDLLPPDDDSAHRIIDLVRQLYDEFVSVEVCEREFAPVGKRRGKKAT